jgi:hypothetical protein
MKRSCSIEGCRKPSQARGWCTTHWARWRRTGDPEYLRPRYSACTIDGCERPPRSATAKLCEAHYYRLRRTGSTELIPATGPLVAGYCARCGEAFVLTARSAAANGARYCSYVCKGRDDSGNYARRQRRALNRERVEIRTLAERDGWRCHICRGKVTRKNWSVDHLVPLISGGDHLYSNVALAHANCNKKRGWRGQAQLRLAA